MQESLKACVEEIRDSNGRFIALRLNISCAKGEGTWIPTPSDWGLQVGVFKHGRGYTVGAHLHPRERYSKYIGCESLFVIRGRLRVRLFDEKGNSIRELTIAEGDCLVMACAHSVEVLEDALVLEVKEGPYPDKERDKVWLQKL